ncbi:MAG: hypothetical protein M1482_02615 [Chloroflexi bacterium]|nr:hypothetical protein [Chloroflexota bacterium]
MSSTDFWKQVGTTDADVEHLYGFLLERGTPAALSELTAHLIEWRVREEDRKLAELAARRAPLYQPKQTFEVGQHLVFTAFDNREGVVTQVRAGENPRLGEFQVITVQLDGDGKVHEFAGGYAVEHPLNADHVRSAESLEMTPEQAVEAHGQTVAAALRKRLSSDKEFVHVGDEWFLRGLLPEIHSGYINLAEAAIEQAGDSVRTSDLLKVLELPPEVKRAAAFFALTVALEGDGRFEDVGPVGDARWYLTRLEPPEARERPPALEAAPVGRISLSGELELIAAELFDEADLNGDANAQPVPRRDEITLVLTYPHRQAGTLPLTPFVLGLVPEFKRPRLKINFVDAQTQSKFTGFAVAQGHYLAGLMEWFNARRLSPGAYVTLKRGADPLTLQIDYQPQRERSLWVRVARGANGHLVFSQEKRPVSHKYDEEMLIVVGDPIGIEAVAEQARHERSLAALLEDIFPELAKLSGAGRVHAKTLYSAINLIRRAGPRSVMSALIESRAFTSVGGGYFVLNEAHPRP